MKSTIKNNVQLLKYVWRYSPETVIWRFITVSLNVAVDATLNVIFLQTVVDAMTRGAGLKQIFKYIIIVTLIMLFHDLSQSIYSQYIDPVGKQKIHKGMHNLLFQKICGIDLEKFDDSDFYNDYIWALKEVDHRTMKSFVMLSEFYKAVASTIVFIIISIQFDWKFLGFIIVPVVIRMSMSVYKTKIQYKLSKELNPVNRRKDYARRTFYLRDYAKEIRMYPISKVLLRIFNESVDDNISIIKKFRNRFVVSTNLETSTYWLFGKLPITIYMCYLVLVCKTLSVGAFVAMYSAASKLMYSMASIFVIIPSLRENGLFAEKIINLLKCESSIEEKDEGEPLKNEISQLEFRHVFFQYPFGKNMVLKDITININKGEKIAIVGLNGAGKTTLIKLLTRFYDPTEGTVLVNGKSAKNYKIKDYRQKFSAVFQDFQLYAVSVKENILMGKELEEENDLTEILHKVELSEFDDKLSANVTKEFDREGIICSGGQKQKLAIARAMVKGAEIIIMDEATSALDPIAEDKIQDLFIKSGKSVIFISHRLSSVKNMDKIYYMESGKIVEAGNHEDLMRINGKYAQMYRIQAEKYRLDKECDEAIAMQ